MFTVLENEFIIREKYYLYNKLAESTTYNHY